MTVPNADVQGVRVRVGVASPFYLRTDTETGRGQGTATVEDSYFRSYVGVAIATAYADPLRPKRATVRHTRFEPLDVPKGLYEPAAVSMNYGMARGDVQRREPKLVQDFNQRRGDTFRVFYSLEVPEGSAPYGERRPQVDGFVCAGGDQAQ